jgi:hypothetical protein
MSWIKILRGRDAAALARAILSALRYRVHRRKTMAAATLLTGGYNRMPDLLLSRFPLGEAAMRPPRRLARSRPRPATSPPAAPSRAPAPAPSSACRSPAKACRARPGASARRPVARSHRRPHASRTTAIVRSTAAFSAAAASARAAEPRPLRACFRCNTPAAQAPPGGRAPQSARPSDVVELRAEVAKRRAPEPERGDLNPGAPKRTPVDSVRRAS